MVLPDKRKIPLMDNPHHQRDKLKSGNRSFKKYRSLPVTTQNLVQNLAPALDVGPTFLVNDLAALFDDVGAVGQTTVCRAYCIVHLVKNDHGCRMEIVTRSLGKELAFIIRFRLVDISKIHLVRMCFTLIEDNEGSFVQILLPDLFNGGSLPPERRSGKRTELYYHGAIRISSAE